MVGQVKKNASACADELVKLGYTICTGGTENHLLLWWAGQGRHSVLVFWSWRFGAAAVADVAFALAGSRCSSSQSTAQTHHRVLYRNGIGLVS